MKKITAVLCTVILLFACFPFYAFAYDGNRVDIADFARDVCALTAKYDKENTGVKTAVQYLEQSPFINCRLLVKSKERISKQGAVACVNGYGDLWVLQYENEAKAEKAYNYYLTCTCVEYAEADAPVTLAYSQQTLPAALSWGKAAVGADEAVEYGNGIVQTLSEVRVGIVDSGVDYNHPFLADRLIDNGVNLSTTGDSTGMSDDPECHGTHVAGILADNTPTCVKLKSYKIFNKNGDSSAIKVSNAIDLAVQNGMDVINLSLTLPLSETVENSLQQAYKEDVLLFGAVGNDGESADTTLPAASPYVVGVGSVGKTLKPSSYCNYGDAVDVLAPGDSIYSTLDNNGYGTLSGTSMATPFAAACGAFYLALSPHSSPEDVENAIKSKALQQNWGEEYKKFYGVGVLYFGDTLPFARLSAICPDKEKSVYENPCTVTFTVPEGETLYYTTDGSLPGKNSSKYTVGFDLTASCTLRWVCYQNDGTLFRSPYSSADYWVLQRAKESDLDVSPEGVLLGYRGEEKAIAVPATVNGISVTSVGSGAFDKNSGSNIIEIYLPDMVTSIAESAFESNSSIESIFANGVKTIGKNAFAQCGELCLCEMPAVTSVGSKGFYSCKKLKAFSAPLLECLGDEAFRNGGLLKAEFPALKTLGLYAFRQSDVESADLPALEDMQCKSTIFCSNAFADCPALKTVSMPKVKTLGKRSGDVCYFENCPSMLSFFAPLLETVGEKMFKGCCVLNNLNVQGALTIGANAFDGCEALAQIQLPKVKTVDLDAFAGCDAEWIYFEDLTSCQGEFPSECVILIPPTALTLPSVNKGYNIIYGMAGSYAESWAKGKNVDFISLNNENAVLTGMPAHWCKTDGDITVSVLGFHRQYHWYGTDYSDRRATALLATTEFPVFNPADYTLDYHYYYCVVQNDGAACDAGQTCNTDFVFTPADYSALRRAVDAVPADMIYYTDDSVNALNAVINEIDYELADTQQDTVDGYTRALTAATQNLQKVNFFVLVFRYIARFFTTIFS